MSKEPLALRQADALEDFPSIVDLMNAASTLRHLHEANTELLEALKVALVTIEDYLDYDHDGDPWTEDARSMGEMDVNDYQRDGRLDRARAAIAKATGETQ